MAYNRIPDIVADARRLLEDRFRDIVFEEGPHKYYVDGVEYTPVSCVIEKYVQPFDELKMSKSVAQRRGVSQEEILKEWKYVNLCSTISGTRTHLFGEAYTWLMAGLPELIPAESRAQYVEDEEWLIPTYPKEIAIKKFYDELSASIYPVGAEFRLSSQYMGVNLKMCGTTDILLYYDDPSGKQSGFIVADWKTNSSLTNDYAQRKRQMMLPPFDFLVDEALSHYIVQFNLYQRMLESVGLPIIARRLIWLKPDGNYEIFKIPKISDEVINLILD